MTTLMYDGTFEGFLSAVFEIYERKIQDAKILKTGQPVLDIFSDLLTVPTNTWHAERVWKGLTKKLDATASTLIYRVFLTELNDVENWMLGYIRYAFSSDKKINTDFGNPYVLKMDQLNKMVGREKHRMEAFIRFQRIEGELYYASIEPDFNVLPLLIPHFKRRYADQQWIIYDVKRAYGIRFDLQQVTFITLDFLENFRNGKDMSASWQEGEELYQVLWKDYFRSVNIKTRKNTKLHLQHVPRRYWKYLTEKTP